VELPIAHLGSECGFTDEGGGHDFFRLVVDFAAGRRVLEAPFTAAFGALRSG
jgi:hypothetical protein